MIHVKGQYAWINESIRNDAKSQVGADAKSQVGTFLLKMYNVLITLFEKN